MANNGSLISLVGYRVAIQYSFYTDCIAKQYKGLIYLSAPVYTQGRFFLIPFNIIDLITLHVHGQSWHPQNTLFTASRLGYSSYLYGLN